VDSEDDLLTMRDRIRSRGVHCFGPMEHGFLKSICFAGPDGMTLEVATLTGEPMHKWIDPSTVEALGMTLDDVPPAEIPHGSVDYAKVILEKQ